MARTVLDVVHGTNSDIKCATLSAEYWYSCAADWRYFTAAVRVPCTQWHCIGFLEDVPLSMTANTSNNIFQQISYNTLLMFDGNYVSIIWEVCQILVKSCTPSILNAPRKGDPIGISRWCYVWTSSPAITERPCDALCLSIVSLNSTKPPAQSSIVSYLHFKFTAVYN